MLVERAIEHQSRRFVVGRSWRNHTAPYCVSELPDQTRIDRRYIGIPLNSKCSYRLLTKYGRGCGTRDELSSSYRRHKYLAGPMRSGLVRARARALAVSGELNSMALATGDWLRGQLAKAYRMGYNVNF